MKKLELMYSKITDHHHIVILGLDPSILIFKGNRETGDARVKPEHDEIGYV